AAGGAAACLSAARSGREFAVRCDRGGRTCHWAPAAPARRDSVWRLFGSPLPCGPRSISARSSRPATPCGSTDPKGGKLMKGKAGDTKAPLSGPLLDAIASIQKDYGEGSIMRLGDRIEAPIDGISTGSLGLDLAIGGKGLPRGRVIEVFGPESSGKT